MKFAERCSKTIKSWLMPHISNSTPSVLMVTLEGDQLILLFMYCVNECGFTCSERNLIFLRFHGVQLISSSIGQRHWEVLLHYHSAPQWLTLCCTVVGWRSERIFLNVCFKWNVLHKSTKEKGESGFYLHHKCSNTIKSVGCLDVPAFREVRRRRVQKHNSEN